MKLGIITDIHNNLPALKAVISALTEAECEKIICAGDIIGIGPYPEETVQYIKSIPNLIVVRGNHEGYLLDGMVKLHTDKCMDEEEIAYHKWEHSLLSKDSVDFLGTLPCRIDFIADGVNVSVIHYATNENGNYSF
jgi:predicted phosphodiesterase